MESRQTEKQALPPLPKPSLFVFVGNDTRATLHINDKVGIGTEMIINKNRVMITKVHKSEKSGYYAKANFYEFDFQQIN